MIMVVMIMMIIMMMVVVVVVAKGFPFELVDCECISPAYISNLDTAAYRF